jgi:hypothetical protein
MEELKFSMSNILLCTLDERFSPQGNHENVEEIKIDLKNHD